MSKTKTPSRREVALTKLRVAGYHADSASFVRLYVEERVSYGVAKEQFRIGAQMHTAGTPCDCFECKRAA
jgi:hypothetical protein